MGYEARILVDSVSEAGDRLTTMEVTFPRLVLAEFNTHRTFSRNSASSRAIPVQRQLARILEDPFVPTYWGAMQSGMQAEGEIAEHLRRDAELAWLQARDEAIDKVKKLLGLGVHKQLTNRLLEPFMWHTVIVTATEWSNFFALRDNAMAQPEIHKIAGMMHELYEDSIPVLVKKGEWHLPLIQPDEVELVKSEPMKMCKVSAARCARVSYLTHDGKRNLDKDLELYERLVTGGHMSPLEHAATPYVRWDGDYPHAHDERWVSRGFVGNFRGWKQLRKFVPNEDDFSKATREE